MRRIAFQIPAETREDVLDGVLPLLPAGIVERELGDGVVEISSVGATLPARAALAKAAGVALDAYEDVEVPADWRARRARYGGGAVLIAGRLMVRSPWDPAAPEGALEVVVERGGSGFGSGSHPTTQMCLSLLLDLEPAGGATDLGCGVGTLGIAAAKLGWSPVAGLDRDEEAIGEAQANARRNGVDARFAHADAEAEDLGVRELMLVNAPPPVHRRLAAAITPQVRHVIASGIVEGELPEVRDAYAAAGLRVAKGMAADTWIAILLEPEPEAHG
jgi:ribosomal protein L11 methyltransferase